MKKRAISLKLFCLMLCLCTVFSVTACQQDTTGSAGTDPVTDSDEADSRVDDGHIDEGLMVPPDDFSIVFTFGVGGKNCYDTVQRKITKDLVLDGTETRDLFVTRNDLAKIYTELMKNDVLSITESMTSANLTDGITYKASKPRRSYRIVVISDGQSYLVSGTSDAAYYEEREDAVRFMAFVRFMVDFTCDTPEYKAMPPHRGGYV